MGFLLYFLSSIIGAQAGYIIAILIDKQTSSNNIVLYSSCITFLILACIITIFLRQKTIFDNIQMLKKSNKNEYVLKTKQNFSISVDGVLKFKLALCLCNFFIEENDFISAKNSIDMIKQTHYGKPIINKKFLSKKLKLEYYLKQIYLSTMGNNIIEAHSCYIRGKKYIDKYISHDEYRFLILNILSQYEYSKGDYKEAENFINDAINNCDDEYKKDELKIFLSKIYYKTERYQKSEVLLEQIICNNSSIENVKNAKKILLQKIV